MPGQQPFKLNPSFNEKSHFSVKKDWNFSPVMFQKMFNLGASVVCGARTCEEKYPIRQLFAIFLGVTLSFLKTWVCEGWTRGDHEERHWRGKGDNSWQKKAALNSLKKSPVSGMCSPFPLLVVFFGGGKRHTIRHLRSHTTPPTDRAFCYGGGGFLCYGGRETKCRWGGTTPAPNRRGGPPPPTGGNFLKKTPVHGIVGSLGYLGSNSAPFAGPRHPVSGPKPGSRPAGVRAEGVRWHSRFVCCKICMSHNLFYKTCECKISGK